MGWTLRHMVVAHGFHLSAFNGHEAGRLGLSLPTLLRVAKALELRPSELLAAAEAQLEVVQELGEGNPESASKKLYCPESNARAAALNTADVTAVHSEKSR